MDLTVPAPLSSVMAYNPENLNERVDYAVAQLHWTTRKPNPCFAKMLTVYLKACIEMSLDYDSLTREQLVQRAEEIREYDDTISTMGWLRETANLPLVESVLQLRRYTYWARYGDYVAHMTSQLRKKTGAEKHDIWQEPSDQYLWTDISTKIKSECSAVKRHGSHKSSLLPTWAAVYEACQASGINFDSVIQIIHMYAEKNEASHLGLKEMVENGNFATIARYVFDDLNDLGSICPPELCEQESAMRALLEELRDEWFDTSIVPNNPGGWNYKEALREYRHGLLQANQNSQQHAQTAGEKANGRLQAADENIVKNGNPTPKVGKSADVADRKEAWKVIQQQQYRRHDNFKKSIAKQKYVNRLIKSYQVSGMGLM